MSATVHSSVARTFALWVNSAYPHAVAKSAELSSDVADARTCQPERRNHWSIASDGEFTTGDLRAAITCPTCVLTCEEAALNFRPDVCVECGALFTAQTMCHNRGWCGACEFWLQCATQYKSGKTFVVSGEAYSFDDYNIHEKEPHWRDKSGLGFGGARFDVELDNGRRVTTHNLWFRGAVPPRFKERLQNNAHFLRPGRTEVPVMVLP